MVIPARLSEEERRRELRSMKRRATALLAVVAGAFAALAAAGGDESSTGAAVMGYALAAAEGGMVGGLADWFAVTALFRHPLGLPIPHTAVIRERKDQFGATLGDFVQENFLSPDVIGDRVRSAAVGDRVAAWLTKPGNGDVVARAVLDAATGALDAVADEDVQRLVRVELERLVGRVEVAPIAGRLLAVVTKEGRHHELLETALKGIIVFLDEQREPLRARFAQDSPWWLPGAVEDRLFDRIIDGARLLLASVVADPKHEMRTALDERLATMAERLQHDPELAQRATALAQELLDHPALRGWLAGVWGDVKTVVRAQAPDPTSELRTRLAGAVAGAGRRLAEDPALAGKVTAAAETAARHVVLHYRSEISEVIATTVSHWDAAETSDKLELLLGRDLQFIRINGTVVGALAGLGLHGLAVLLG